MPTQTYFNLPIDKQQRIMDAIIHEMGINTYENLNVANIIRQSQIPRGSFYQYFIDKEDLFNYFYQVMVQKKIEYMGDLFLGNLDIPFLERFEKLYASGIKFGTQNNEIFKASQKIFTSDYFMKSKMMKQGNEQGISMFTLWIKHDQELGRIKKSIDAELLASLLLEFSSKVTFEEYFKDEVDLLKIETKIHLIVEILKKGIE